jgi:ATP-binding cassette, subfamily A (ABC1), member 3
MAIPIFWQIFAGWATTHSAIFATAFFRNSSAAVTIIFVIAFLLAVIANFVVQMIGVHPPAVPEIAILSLLFPSMNYVFFLDFLVRFEAAELPTTMGSPLPGELLADMYGSFESERWVWHTGPYLLWILSIIQILVFPVLAGFVEHWMHGNNRRRRDFNRHPDAGGSHVAIEAAGLEKYYGPSIWRKIFCCGGGKPIVKAVDGLNLTSQKHQILCLLGPNGSGKTTTLDMIAGFQRPTGGSVNINALPSQIGVCPQKNILWDEMTVFEHLTFWNTIKSGHDDAAELEKLVQRCDLVKKRNTMAKNLSGGMKRKLQLACMLVGGSSVCLMDEVTSGLDPISRRVIWNAVLAERSRRTMVFTTHFLDESEVLSDHIVIVSLGKVKCQGTPAELKNQYGAGYRVHLPKTANVSAITYPVVDHGDRYICRTPDSSSAARLLATFEDTNESQNFITGPTIEDVFLKVSEEPHVVSDSSSDGGPAHEKPNTASPSSISDQSTKPHVIFFRQFSALFTKRIIILRSQWWAYILTLAIPIIATCKWI